MSFDEVLEKAIIKFPKPLSIKETEALFKYFAIKLPSSVQYKVSYNKSIGNRPEYEGSLLKLNHGVEFAAQIRSFKNGAFDWFSCEPDDDYQSKISLIRFSMNSGGNLSKYDKKTVELWDDIRNLVTDYFNQKNSKSTGN